MQIHSNKFYPMQQKSKRVFKHTVFVGLGGNIGDVPKRFKRLFFYLSRRSDIHIKATSPILKNPPFGYLKQDDFYNAVMQMETSMSPRALLKTLLHTEKRFGRRRSFPNAPRTLDLDIIFFDDVRYSDRHLCIPHPKWSERDSVVIPLELLLNRQKDM